MARKSNKMTPFVDFSYYKEPIREEFFGSGYSPFASLVGIFVLGFFVFYLIFGIDDPIRIFDVLVDKITQFAKLTSYMAKVWNYFTSYEVDTLQFGDLITSLPKDWSDHFMTPSELFKFFIGLLFPEKVGVS